MNFKKLARTSTLAILVVYHPLLLAGSKEVGIKIFQRLSGIPPNAAQLAQIEKWMEEDNKDSVADLAMGTKAFYSATVKSFASPLTNVSRLATIDLNDFSATIIGMVRDKVPLNQALYEDIVYIGDKDKYGGLIAFADNDNSHYRELDLKGVDLSNPSLLVRRKQSEVTNMLEENTMGVMTSRAAGEAYYKDGTNRRIVEFIMVDFFCKDMIQLNDISLSDHRVRRDVPRDAGGDSYTYINRCSGCHAGMDALAGAFAHYDWQPERVSGDVNVGSKNHIQVIPTVRDKYHRNDETFANGYNTVDDSWVNLWSKGQNSNLGWRTPKDGTNIASGSGAKSLGKVLASAFGFSQCMAQRAFAQVCSRNAPYTDAEVRLFTTMAKGFEAQNYNAKYLFAESAKACTGE